LAHPWQNGAVMQSVHVFVKTQACHLHVQAALAAKLQTTVTAHDMPGFGLTER